MATSRFPMVIVLDRLRSAFNVGNIFRLAEAVAAERIIACGYTPCPPHPKLAKSARGCDETVPCEHAETAAAAVLELKRQGYCVYAVETVEEAGTPWNTHLQFPAAMLFGNEAMGIDRQAMELCDAYLQLPTFGFKNSLNVGNCAAVVLYNARQQWTCSEKAEG